MANQFYWMTLTPSSILRDAIADHHNNCPWCNLGQSQEECYSYLRALRRAARLNEARENRRASGY